MEVHKVTLSSGKIVYLRESKISDTESAAKIAGKGAGDNQLHATIVLQKELIKLLLVQVNDTKLSMTDKEQLDKWLTVAEYSQVLKVVNKISGPTEEGNEPVIEFVSFGDK